MFAAVILVADEGDHGDDDDEIGQSASVHGQKRAERSAENESENESGFSRDCVTCSESDPWASHESATCFFRRENGCPFEGSLTLSDESGEKGYAWTRGQSEGERTNEGRGQGRRTESVIGEDAKMMTGHSNDHEEEKASGSMRMRYAARDWDCGGMSGTSSGSMHAAAGNENDGGDDDGRGGAREVVMMAEMKDL